MNFLIKQSSLFPIQKREKQESDIDVGCRVLPRRNDSCSEAASSKALHVWRTSGGGGNNSVWHGARQT